MNEKKHSNISEITVCGTIALLLAVIALFRVAYVVCSQEREGTPNTTLICETDVEMLSKLLWGEARGVESTTEKAAVVWCVLNRVDSSEFPNDIPGVITQANQFTGYKTDYPVTDEHTAIVYDVLTRWNTEKTTGKFCGRVLPGDYTYFNGDGSKNVFRNAYKGGEVWNWSLGSPYEN